MDNTKRYGIGVLANAFLNFAISLTASPMLNWYAYALINTKDGSHH